MSVPFRLNEIVCKSTAWLRREVFKPVFTCPAAWCFAAIWAVVAVYLVAIGRISTVLSALCLFAILMFFCVITVGSWAIVIQALLFGIWHFAANIKYVCINGNTAVIAFNVVVKATAFGLVFGIIFQRTRNLLACSVIHVVANSLRG